MMKNFYMPFPFKNQRSLETDRNIRLAFVQLESRRGFTSVFLQPLTSFAKLDTRA